jgi:UDP-3-O-acyl-N-acetylglucosamine deacetylase
VAGVLDLKIQKLSAEIKKLEDAKNDSILTTNLLESLDTDGDGTVTRVEFLAAAIRGYVIDTAPAPSAEEPPTKKSKP